MIIITAHKCLAQFLTVVSSSALKQKNCVFATVVDVQCLVGLTSDVEAKALAHDAMPSVTKSLVHLFFYSLASLINSNAIFVGTFFNTIAHNINCFFFELFIHISLNTQRRVLPPFVE